MADKVGKKRGGRRQSGMPTVADVAREAQVSPMTVSRVINNEEYVSERTREIVKRAVTKLNYSPSRAARSLAGVGEQRIALIYSNPSPSYLNELLMGGLRKVNGTDAYLTVEHCDIEDDGLDLVRNLAEAGVQGFLLTSPLCDEPRLLDLSSQLGVHVVAIGAGNAPQEHSAMLIDDYQAAFDMTRHIINLGHKDIAFISGNPRQVSSSKRLTGYEAAMAASDLPIHRDFVQQGMYTYRSGLAAAERLLALKHPPTAIFASNDDMAAATVAAAHKCQIDVPSELTVCGFDDVAIASTIWPELTTIRQPIADMAAKAVETLAAELRKKSSGQSITIEHTMMEYTLIQRNSDAPPFASGQNPQKDGRHDD